MGPFIQRWKLGAKQIFPKQPRPFSWHGIYENGIEKADHLGLKQGDLNFPRKPTWWWLDASKHHTPSFFCTVYLFLILISFVKSKQKTRLASTTLITKAVTLSAQTISINCPILLTQPEEGSPMRTTTGHTVNADYLVDILLKRPFLSMQKKKKNLEFPLWLSSNEPD